MFCFASLLLMGCASSQPTRFFVLNAIESARQEPAQPCRNDASITIGINPVSVPRYLDRPQIMTKVSANEFKLSELNVWAERSPTTSPASWRRTWAMCRAPGL
jgi:uncharacterized lipoprotein YmbA